MILDRLKDILIANIQDQLHNNPLFNEKLAQTFDDLDKEFNFKGYFRSEDRQDEFHDQHDYNWSSTQGQYGGQQRSVEQKERGYYADLEVPYGSDFTVIKKAYRKQMKVYHPDRYHNEPEKHRIAQEVSLKINEAYRYFENKYQQQ